jgi:hypothetical protein
MTWLFVSLHASWFFLAVANMSPPSPALGTFFDNGGGSSAALLAGRPFHFVYDSFALKLLLLADLPSYFLTIPLGVVADLFVLSLHLGHYRGSYVGAALWLLGGSIQWLLMGYAFDLRCEKVPFLSKFAGRLKACVPLVIVLVLLVTAIGAAALNARSHRLGFRHAGISFGRVQPGLNQ